MADMVDEWQTWLKLPNGYRIGCLSLTLCCAGDHVTLLREEVMSDAEYERWLACRPGPPRDLFSPVRVCQRRFFRQSVGVGVQNEQGGGLPSTSRDKPWRTAKAKPRPWLWP